MYDTVQCNYEELWEQQNLCQDAVKSNVLFIIFVDNMKKGGQNCPWA
jgi:hypothetical protein